MTNPDQYIRFDWAMKRLLRNKASFGILEGLLTTLLEKQIRIKSLLEGESNQEDRHDKQNRVDVLAEDDKGHLYIIEVQNNNETVYFQRMLFGTSKLVTEYINRGENYEKIRKIYSVNIVYFQLGHGTDTVYHGKTEFHGIHTGELLDLSPFQKQSFNVDSVSALYPEYYILNVQNFDGVATTPLQEWIHYLKTGLIPASATAPGLDEARERLRFDQMSKGELEAYYHSVDDLNIIADNVRMARGEGRIEGFNEGFAEGERRKQIEIARKLKQAGLDASAIASTTGLDWQEIEEL